MHKIKQLSLISRLLVVSLAVVLIAQPITTQASTVDELQQRSTQLQAEISANNQKLKELSGIAITLQEKIDQLNIEIEQANKEIALTEVKLEELKVRLDKANKELKRRKELLKATLQALYERKGASTLELLMATDSFTDFINEQEYLGQLQSAVKQATEEVLALKQQIEEEKNTQEKLLKKQQEQRNIVDAKRSEQQTLLDQTKGEENQYRSIVAQQQAELEKAESELAKLLSAGTYVSYGPVARGAVIGAVGSTGFSTGPHIHFQVYKDGVTQNPYLGEGQLVNGYAWPLFDGAGYISQAYGCVAPAWYYSIQCNNGQNSFHTGLDIATSAYTPVVAVADGEVIFKGCRAGLGYVVVVNHGSGWQTWYPHMITPSGQVFGYCE